MIHLTIFGSTFNFLISIVMGLLDKSRPKATSNEVSFSREELQFLLAKLRTAEYKGNEFEKFYNVYTKIQDQLDKDK